MSFALLGTTREDTSLCLRLMGFEISCEYECLSFIISSGEHPDRLMDRRQDKPNTCFQSDPLILGTGSQLVYSIAFLGLWKSYTYLLSKWKVVYFGWCEDKTLASIYLSMATKSICTSLHLGFQTNYINHTETVWKCSSIPSEKSPTITWL